MPPRSTRHEAPTSTCKDPHQPTVATVFAVQAKRSVEPVQRVEPTDHTVVPATVQDDGGVGNIISLPQSEVDQCVVSDELSAERSLEDPQGVLQGKPSSEDQTPLAGSSEGNDGLGTTSTCEEVAVLDGDATRVETEADREGRIEDRQGDNNPGRDEYAGEATKEPSAVNVESSPENTENDTNPKRRRLQRNDSAASKDSVISEVILGLPDSPRSSSSWSPYAAYATEAVGSSADAAAPRMSVHIQPCTQTPDTHAHTHTQRDTDPPTHPHIQTLTHTEDTYVSYTIRTNSVWTSVLVFYVT